jgi:phosphatidylserine decarboxylase
MRFSWLKNKMIKGFIWIFQVNMSDALEPDACAYPDFNAFFTRALRLGVRPLADGDRAICCPVDGTISQIGIAEADTLLQAKDHMFSITNLLGGNPARALPFRDGYFATIYLSPRDYHRVHMPLSGQLMEMIHIPGKLFSVSPLTVQVVSSLFARNERVVMLFETAAGQMAIVLVGAINVASIETVWAGSITPPLGKKIRRWVYQSSGSGITNIDKGMELGRFNMGSTVILLFGHNKVLWDPKIRVNTILHVGHRIGEIQ